MSDFQLEAFLFKSYFCSLFIRMEDVSAGKKVLKRMYEYFIEIANKTIRDPTSPIEAMFEASECREVLRSRLDNLIE